jgi:protein-disulfide isomerase
MMVMTLGVGSSCLAQDVLADHRVANAAGQTSEREDRIAEELKQIRLQLERLGKRLAAVVPAEEPVKIEVSTSYAIGQKDAPVTVIEFADYQCPFCRQFHAKTFEKLHKNYIDTGKVRFVALDLPLSSHTDAFKAAEAALCAGDQSKFWEMRNLLLTNDRLGVDVSLGYAEQLGLDKALFRSCLESGRNAAKVRGDEVRAEDLDINATPTFIIGRTQEREVEGVKLVGILSYARLEARIRGLLDPQQ